MYVLVKKIPSLNFFSEPPWHSQTGRVYWLQKLVSDDRDTVLKYDIKWTSTRAGVGQKWAQVDTGKGGDSKILWTSFMDGSVQVYNNKCYERQDHLQERTVYG